MKAELQAARQEREQLAERIEEMHAMLTTALYEEPIEP